MPRKSKKQLAASRAAKRGWETRRANERKRSQAARKGWLTRQANKNRKKDQEAREGAQKGKPQPQSGRETSPAGRESTGTGKKGRRRAPIVEDFGQYDDWVEVVGIDSLYED